MKKRLLLIRHGKSDWGNSQLTDFNRPLNSRGARNAPEMANRILQKNQVPGKIISSPAVRAITTAKYFSKIWNIPSEDILEKSEIYEANVIALLHVVNDIDDKQGSIALFGHNPGLTNFANYLCDANIHNIPTCGTVLIEFDTEHWSELTQCNGKLVEFDYPKSADED